MFPFRPLLAPVLIAASLAISAFPASAEDPGDELGELIQHRLREGGPFFTAEEQAVVNRACGYAPGEWDGFELDLQGDVLHCTNGRDIRDPEVRRIVRAAGPRIAGRVSAIMDSPEIRAAIERITEEATAEAMRELARLGD